MMSHTPSAHSSGYGRNASNAPPLVAIPFPPLKLSQQVQLWPAITNKQQTICSALRLRFGKIWGAKKTGTKPFAASISSTAMPGPLPSARITFVAPMLPLPTVRMSMPRALPHRKPVGIEPRRYERIPHPTKIAAVMSPTLTESAVRPQTTKSPRCRARHRLQQRRLRVACKK